MSKIKLRRRSQVWFVIALVFMSTNLYTEEKIVFEWNNAPRVEDMSPLPFPWEIAIIDPEPTEGPFSKLTENRTFDWDPSFAPNGSGWIAFVSNRDGDDEIWAVKWNKTDLRQITNNTVPDWHPSFSPNGEKIVFSSKRNGNWDIYLKNANGSGSEQRLTSDLAFDWMPCFSRNGDSIAFVSNRTDGNWDIWLMAVDGSHQRRVTTSEHYDGYPCFSPVEDNIIVFVSDRSNSQPGWRGDWDVYLINKNIGDDSAVQLTDDSNSDWGPCFSPQGNKITWVSGSTICLMNYDGSGIEQLTINPYSDFSRSYAMWFYGNPSWGEVPGGK